MAITLFATPGNLAAEMPEVLLAIFVFLATILIMAPVTKFLYIGWSAKREDIMDGQSADARHKYFAMFHRTKRIDKEDAFNRFDEFYIQWYGRKRYIAAATLLLLVGFVSSYVGISSAMYLNGSVAKDQSPMLLPPLALYALSGGYLWVVNDLIRRSRKLDLAPSDLYWGVLRLVVAVPLGYGMSSFFLDIESIRHFIAFSAGAFPLSDILTNIRKMSLTKSGLKIPDGIGNDNVINLVGVNADVAERLANEDITTITQLAYCDPIRLTMRSNLTFNFVTDCMNQALAWEYMEDRMNKLRPLGLRGAVEIRHLYHSIETGTDDEKTAANSVLDCAAKILEQDRITLKMAFFEISGDPFTAYLESIWTDG
ncbi:MAG TPA: hypothetical protein VFE77_06530 [Rhodanobacter sp.]|nr:hypothetical protein [Rhodanobacter sp.]